jgi:uncharacterized protein (DUF2249 family)
LEKISFVDHSQKAPIASLISDHHPRPLHIYLHLIDETNMEWKRSTGEIDRLTDERTLPKNDFFQISYIPFVSLRDFVA